MLQCSRLAYTSSKELSVHISSSVSGSMQTPQEPFKLTGITLKDELCNFNDNI